jgi:hypothetical protein
VKATRERKRILLLEIEENRAAVIGETRAVRRSVRSVFDLASMASGVVSLLGPVARIAGLLRGSRRKRGGFLSKLALWLPIALPIIKVLRRRS